VVDVSKKSSSPELSPPKLNLVVVRASDMEVSQRFYELLGLQFIKHQHGSGPEHLCAELNGEVVFEIYPTVSGATEENHVRLGFTVSNVDTLLSVISSNGYTVHTGSSQTQWGYRAVVLDPDNNRVELVQA
jgi:lactoylglutathione lyase